MTCSLSSSPEAALNLTYGYGKQELIRDGIDGAKGLQDCPGCKLVRVGHKRSLQDTEKENNCTCSLNHLSSQSQDSTVGAGSGNSSLIFVYQRRQLPKIFSSVCLDQGSTKVKPNGSSVTEISCEAPSMAAKAHLNPLAEVETEADKALLALHTKCNRRALPSKSSSMGCCLAKELDSVEHQHPKCDELKNVDACLVNDSCSSSQLNTDPCATLSKPEVDTAGECSSSDALVMDGLLKMTSEKDVFTSIYKVLGINEAVWPYKTRVFSKGHGTTNSNCIHLLSCKVCDQLELTVKMLICNQCEEATHLSCCNPPVKKIPRSEWFCHSCFKKGFKVLKETSRVSLKRNSVMNRNRNSASKCALGPIPLMLKEDEPYTTNVRVGPEYQAVIPVCCGPIANEIENIGEPLEIYPSVGLSYQEGNLGKNIQSSICNWLQCRQVMDGEGVDGNVCGKWRRAPLFELQTDNWECFHSFLWDPTHADCAVPQELDTDRVLKDLKYIEMLRPRLAAKKRKFGCTKKSDPKGPGKAVRNAGALKIS